MAEAAVALLPPLRPMPVRCWLSSRRLRTSPAAPTKPYEFW